MRARYVLMVKVVFIIMIKEGIYMLRVVVLIWLLLYAEALMPQPEASVWFLNKVKGVDN